MAAIGLFFKWELLVEWYYSTSGDKFLTVNIGVTTGGQGEECPLTLLTGKFLLTYREKEGRTKGNMEKKRRKIKRGKVENWKFIFIHSAAEQATTNFLQAHRSAANEAIASWFRSFSASQKASVNRIGSLSSAVLVSFCCELEHTGHIFCMAPLQAS